ncbi:CDP-alcohol phosphatidyltransferase family protein [Brevibacterium jeotgali]|uniref:CDP-alcohol phosphatidyltransferase n=1 Tax=Brevibacterium jeotgali TaxID=1262550 RepID=A0A2H1L8Q1_9MICO|nr:CDP-alcohol phosphatidyltransferase family protein [Brevibacterium jeotgali]TWB98818.1 CDP-alcohol phosphatidyltransferase-like enzyme [Brevibacterium jeotgali]SMY13175.1 CDP-alcohol phosphatidyltransferase [Brevibacterium jeotgali]
MSTGQRTTSPTLAELRAVAQPPHVRARKNAEHWTAELYLRHISIYLTAVLVRTPISANGVTALMILSGWGIAAALFIPGIVGALLALFFSQLQLYFDCCDGEVARWRGTSSAKGVFLDKVGHYTTEGAVAIALGLRAVGDLSLLRTDPGQAYPFVVAGLALGWCVLLNKALNDMVHVARAFNGLDKLPDTAAATDIPRGAVAALKRTARFVPFHRLYHSVEMSLLAVVAAVIGLAPAIGITADRVLVVGLAVLCAVSVAGHFVAIMASRRLG